MDSGSGLPSNIGKLLELWTDGTDLVVGSADLDNFGQFRDGFISHLDSQGNWNTYDTGSNGIPDGYPISMTECGGILNIAVYQDSAMGVLQELIFLRKYRNLIHKRGIR